ncbi:hypothetical protein BGX24_003500 [Mortierella sp. AD032]|nr:hypothetical protein BGX24_003500 [Mortierella sp. AD032]
MDATLHADRALGILAIYGVAVTANKKITSELLDETLGGAKFYTLNGLDMYSYVAETFVEVDTASAGTDVEEFVVTGARADLGRDDAAEPGRDLEKFGLNAAGIRGWELELALGEESMTET